MGIFISQQEEYTKDQKKEARENNIFLINRDQLIGIIKENKEILEELKKIILEKTNYSEMDLK